MIEGFQLGIVKPEKYVASGKRASAEKRSKQKKGLIFYFTYYWLRWRKLITKRSNAKPNGNISEIKYELRKWNGMKKNFPPAIECHALIPTELFLSGFIPKFASCANHLSK